MSGGEPAKKARANEAEERRLVEAAQRDPVQFSKLYENYFELVYAFVARRLRERGATEDVTAEVFHKALKNLPRYRWTGAPFAVWLFRIASNLIADRARRETQSGASSEVDLESSADNAQTNLQAEIEQSERQAIVFRLVSELGEDQQRVIVMRFAEDRSIAEIALELGRTEGAIKQLQFRAMHNLRQMLEQKSSNE